MAGNPLQPVGGQNQVAAQGERRALTGPGRGPSDPVLTLPLGTGWLSHPLLYPASHPGSSGAVKGCAPPSSACHGLPNRHSREYVMLNLHSSQGPVYPRPLRKYQLKFHLHRTGRLQNVPGVKKTRN